MITFYLKVQCCESATLLYLIAYAQNNSLVLSVKFIVWS